MFLLRPGIDPVFVFGSKPRRETDVPGRSSHRRSLCDVISSPVVVWYYQEKEITEEHRTPQQLFNATADNQESVTLTCITSGSPQPILTWHRKGQHLELSERYLLHNADGGRSTLTIRNIGQADGGAYACKATNKAGSQEKELFLKVFVPPHITQLRNVTAVEGSAAMISCMAEGEPLPNISWKRASDGQAFVEGDERPQCSVINKTLLSGNLQTFLTNQTIFYSWEGNPVNFSCDVSSDPPAAMLRRRERFTIAAE
ncbi:hypothetical protein NHX12_015334, partial [Muraenolepis orangiensis]